MIGRALDRGTNSRVVVTSSGCVATRACTTRGVAAVGGDGTRAHAVDALVGEGRVRRERAGVVQRDERDLGGGRVRQAEADRRPHRPLVPARECVATFARDRVADVHVQQVVVGAKNRLESQRCGHFTVGRWQAREHTVEIMNRLHWSRAVRDAVLAAYDVLRARSAALVRARGDAPLEHRLRKIDRLVAVGAEHLEPVVLEGRGRRDAPPYDRNVFLGAVDQLDVLRGVGRRDEVQLAAAGGRAPAAPMRGRPRRRPAGALGRPGGRTFAVVENDARGYRMKSLGPAAQKPKQEPCLATVRFRSEWAHARPRLSLKIGKRTIRMSRTDCRVIWATCLNGVAIAGCRLGKRSEG